MCKELDIIGVHERLLKMAVAIRDILERHDIHYFITYGTLLGAVRHKGFIPWDDDFDFILLDDEYDEAIEILRKELPSDMFVEDEKSEPRYFHGWAHVKDLGTIVNDTLSPQDGAYSHKGLCVDLFRAYPIRLSDEEHVKAKLHLEYIERRYAKGLLPQDDYLQRKESLTKILQHNPTSLPEDEEIFFSPSIYSESHVLKKELFPLEKLDFEGEPFLVPNNYTACLRRWYGDYMLLPPEDRRVTHYSSVTVNDHDSKPLETEQRKEN